MPDLKSLKSVLMSHLGELRRTASRADIAVERLPDSLDEVQHSAEREFAITSLSLQWQTVRQIEAALTRIKEGTYGACRECEDDIGDKRLRAIPWAVLCIRCQEARDALQGHASLVMDAA
jgi:DnaK suppressor protein